MSSNPNPSPNPSPNPNPHPNPHPNQVLPGVRGLVGFSSAAPTEPAEQTEPLDADAAKKAAALVSHSTNSPTSVCASSRGSSRLGSG